MAGPILRTKLFRPPVPRDYVHRPRVDPRLEAARDSALTVVCAPAGYGKTSLVSWWIESRSNQSAWISMGPAEDNARDFHRYLAAAIRGAAPELSDAVGEIDAMLLMEDLPSAVEMGERWANQLAELDRKVLIAIDDFHVVTDSAVHSCLDRLLEYPPPCLRLVLISRRDPPLRLARMRARGQLAEIRTSDLRFDLELTSQFLATRFDTELDQSAADLLYQLADGWPVVLRLAASALEGRDFGDSRLTSCTDTALEEYLLDEVMSRQPVDVQNWMRRASLLERFTPELVHAVCADLESRDGSMTGLRFVEALKTSGLPTVPLDEDGSWQRYHHLIGGLLRQQLEGLISACEIGEIHLQAAAWFESEGLFEDALAHWVASGNLDRAADFIKRHRHEVVDAEQGHRLDSWLGRLPPEWIDGDPELSMLVAWGCDHRGLYTQYSDLRRRIAEALPGVEPLRRRLRLEAEHASLESGWFFLTGDCERALENARRAIEGLPRRFEYERAHATKIFAVASVIVGDLCGAYEALRFALERGETISETTRGHLLIARCLVHTVAGDRAGLERTATAILDYPWRRTLPETVAMARYALGLALFEANELAKAREHLEYVVEDEAPPNVPNQLRATYALAALHRAQGASSIAFRLLDRGVERLHRIGNASFLDEIAAFRAELALRDGRSSEAIDWAVDYQPSFPAPGFSFFLPELTRTKALLASGRTQELERALELARALVARLRAQHSTRFLIEALALESLALESFRRRQAAAEVMGRALRLAISSRYIRLFADLGPSIEPILLRLSQDQELEEFAGSILRSVRRAVESQTLIEPLTRRELEVLALMAEHFTNARIATDLSIAIATVKRHTANIYGKLEVNSRRHAVIRARELGILAA